MLTCKNRIYLYVSEVVAEQNTALEEKRAAAGARSWWWPIQVTVLRSRATV